MNHLCGWALGMILVGTVAGTAAAGAARPDWAKADLKAGMIGTDTSHCMAFANLFHAHPEWGIRVVAAFKNGSRDNPESWNRVEGYAKELNAKHAIEICDTVDALLGKVDVVLIECVDGRPHLEYARPVLAAKKRLFIDKPFTAGLADAREIIRLAKESGTPFFSCSCVRFQPNVAPFRCSPLPRGEGKGEGALPAIPSQFRRECWSRVPGVVCRGSWAWGEWQRVGLEPHVVWREEVRHGATFP